jgi:hypothetical protein
VTDTTDYSHTFMPLTLRRRGVQRMVQAPTGTPGAHDVTLGQGIARAFFWQGLIDSGEARSGSDIARAEGVHHSVVNELLRLTLLAPDLVECFLEGRQPRRLTLMWFQRHALPVDWAAQRALVATFEGAR